ncbi:hypothetical protein Ddc_07955 [Ditylenchus destructor]|nr:hypothetical protein Ddc_07955 [Ditylenchus destructor]
MLRQLYANIALLLVFPQLLTATFSFLSPTKPTLQHHLNSGIYAVPQEGTDVIFNCTAGDELPVEQWILPNGELISMTNSRNKDSDTRGNRTTTFIGTIVFTDHSMIIVSIRVGMDGRYSCVYGEGQLKKSFFIPYVTSEIGFSGSAVLSLTVSAVFCLVCLLVLCVDRYYQSRKASIDEGPVMEHIRTRRKTFIAPIQEVDSESFTELEDLPPISRNSSMEESSKSQIYTEMQQAPTSPQQQRLGWY